MQNHISLFINNKANLPEKHLALFLLFFYVKLSNFIFKLRKKRQKSGEKNVKKKEERRSQKRKR